MSFLEKVEDFFRIQNKRNDAIRNFEDDFEKILIGLADTFDKKLEVFDGRLKTIDNRTSDIETGVGYIYKYINDAKSAENESSRKLEEVLGEKEELEKAAASYRRTLEEKDKLIATYQRDLNDLIIKNEQLTGNLGNGYEIYLKYKGREEFVMLFDICLDSYGMFAVTCCKNLAMTYSKILRRIGDERVSDELDQFIDDCISIYNECNEQKLRRQEVNVDDRYERQLHSSVDYSSDGDPITGVLIQGIIYNGVNKRVFDKCYSRITTK